jgi:iron complex outermembrane receptor protein
MEAELITTAPDNLGKQGKNLKRRRDTLLLAITAALGGTAWPAALHAQEARAGYSLQLEEVVVTAQKREEDYMAVPVTVNAFTAQDMVNTGAVNIQDIDDFMPGVEVSDGGSTQVGITVRGVSSPNISSGQDPSVATFYDGSYMPRAVTSIPFTDIARTEVLKGPQGTLFGRNATAGVINIVPNDPHGEFEGFIKSRLGNYGLVRLEGMVNAPLADSIALRANVFSHQRDGIVENVGIGGDIRDEQFIAARLSVLFTLSDETDIQLSYDMEDRDEEPRQTIGVSKYAYRGNPDPFSGKAANDVAGQEETREMYGVALKLNHDFNERLSLFGVVSYREWDTTNLEDEDGTADPRRYLDTNNIEDSDILYSEIRFNYVNARMDLIVGGNYSEESVFQRTDIHTLADSYMQFVSVEAGLGQDEHLWDIFGDNPVIYEALTEANGVAVIPPSFAGELLAETMDNSGNFVNWGVFGDLSYQLTDSLRLAAGLRYSYDEKDYSWKTYPSDLAWPLPPARLAYEPADTGAAPADYFDKFEDSEDWSKTTGRLVADWAFSDQAMTYLSYATGYKSGGFDGQVFSAYVAGPFDPEEMESIEWGMKGDFFDASLRLEAALFHHELDGRQRSVDAKEGPDDPTAQPTVISSDEKSDGIELIVQWNVLENLRLTGMTTYRETDSESEPYYDAAGELQGGGKESIEPRMDYTLRFDWTPQVPVGYLLVHVDYVFQEAESDDQIDTIFVTGPWYLQDRKRLSARVAWQNDADTLEIALWGQNLLDEEYAENPGGFVADVLGAPHTSIEDPLTWGVDLRYSF